MEAEQAEKIRRHADRTAGIGADREIDETGSYCHSRSARRTAANAFGASRVDRAAIIDIATFEAEGEFVGDGLSDERCARNGAFSTTSAERSAGACRASQSGLPALRGATPKF